LTWTSLCMRCSSEAHALLHTGSANKLVAAAYVEPPSTDSTITQHLPQPHKWLYANS
jgi:hypothetical protein